MIQLTAYKAYFEGLRSYVAGLRQVQVVNVEQDMSDTLRNMRTADLPCLFVVVPSIHEQPGDADSVSEQLRCLVFLMDRSDRQRRTPLQVLEETQPVIESVKSFMRAERARGCSFMRGLGPMTTMPETGFYTDFCGWSVSFTLETD